MSVKEPYSFKLKLNESYSTSGITLDANLTDKYSDEVVELAKQLKAKNDGKSKVKYSDAFYLQYAKSMKLQYLQGRSGEIYHNQSNDCIVEDSQWANYSYEEIIEMEHNGVKIPEDVLVWAHAQQQDDITSYVMVSDETNTEDSSTTSDSATGDSDTNALQKKAKEYILQAEKAQEQSEIQYNEHKIKVEKANNIKRKKENNYQETMDNVSKKVDEWKKLDEKKKQGGHLSFTERLRYKQLSKLLDSSEGKLIKDLQADSNDLEEFLDSLSGMDSTITEDTKISQDTILAGKNLGGQDQKYNSETQTHETRGTVYDGNGSSSDVLFNVTGDEIANLAIEKGTDLQTFSQTMDEAVTDNISSGLVDFAGDYTDRAAQAQEKITNKDSNKEEQEQQKAEDDAKDAESDFKGYSVSKSISYKNSIKASLITARATVETAAHQVTAANSDKKVKKSLKKSLKETKELNKEAEKSAAEHEKNMQQEEDFLNQLERVREEAQTKASEQENQNINSEQNKMQKAQNTQPEQETGKTEPEQEQQQQPEVQDVQEEDANSEASAEEQNIIGQIETVETEDKKDTSKVKKSAQKAAASNAKFVKETKTLTTQNTELAKRSANLNQISEDTMFVGVGTIAKSIISNAVGNLLVSTGTALMSSPYTYSQGLKMDLKGIDYINLGIKEATYGTVAVGTAAVGLVSSSVADDKVSDINGVLKETKIAQKSSTQAVKAAGVTTNAADAATEASTGTAQNAGGNQENAADTQTAQQPSAQENTQITTTAEATQNTTAATETSVSDPTETAAAKTTNTETEATENTNNDQTTKVQNQTTETEKAFEKTSEKNAQNTNNKTQENATENKQQKTGEKSDNENKEQQGEDAYNVDLKFSSENAIAATQTTNKATNNMLSSSSGVEKLTTSILAQVKKNSQLVKNVSKAAKKAQEQQVKNNQQTALLTAEISGAQTTMAGATTAEEQEAAQQKITNASAQIASSADEGTTTDFDKTVLKAQNELKAFNSKNSNLTENTSSLNSIISSQLKASQKTLVVGVGTTAKGGLDIYNGSNKIFVGEGLMGDPFTFNAGLAMTIKGGLQLVKGTTEIATGAAASVTGAEGISANAGAVSISGDSAAAGKTAKASYKETNKEIQNSKTETEELTKQQTQAAEQIPNATVDTISPQKQNSDETEIAASSTNINAAGTTETDDKADRRLTRFNADSIIESKKKHKKVLAVSASSGGKA